MIQKIKDYIRQYQIICPQDHIICGVSGGADSVCLFLVLRELSRELDFTLEAIHVEHGIRGEESCKDMEFTKALCAQYGVECSVVTVDVPSYAKENGLGTEEAARLLRYQAFINRARICMEKQQAVSVKVALAHHVDDNAETVLFQMLRGSGVKGLGGISPIRHEDGVSFIRPLLGIERREIEAYLENKGQAYCTDSTNLDSSYDRNRIRNIVFPELRRINSQAASHINQSAAMVAEAWDYINSVAIEAQREVVSCKNGEHIIDIAGLLKLHPAVRNEVILNVLSEVAGRRKDITAAHVGLINELSTLQSGRRFNLPYGMVAVRQYDSIIIGKAKSDSDDLHQEINILITPQILQEARKEPYCVLLDGEYSNKQLVLSVKKFGGESYKIPKKAYTKWLDYDKIKDGFSIRNRKAGDFFINDDKGHRKKLKEHFIDEKIPSIVRDSILLLAKDSEVIDIVGGRLAEPYKVTDNTKEILQVSYNGGNNDGF